MRLSPKEIEKIVLHNAGFIAQKRLWRGLRLNYPESMALLATQILEFIRDGQDVAALMDTGKKILGFEDVLPGVAELLQEVQVEGTFPDGTKLVTVHVPICLERGDRALALYGSGLDVEQQGAPLADSTVSESDSPGSYELLDDAVVLNANRETVEVEVTNTGDRPIQVGSHYPFFETNLRLNFNREQAYGFRLDIPSGTAVRFEPGESKTVGLVKIAGERVIYGGNGFISGEASSDRVAEALENVESALKQ
ncbi:MAG TPA: urease subunit beta [Candidatus Hydrogenedentes bacterium]|nr:urease subunit beta [Candidatus Hydrogenedentota bacterium]